MHRHENPGPVWYVGSVQQALVICSLLDPTAGWWWAPSKFSKYVRVIVRLRPFFEWTNHKTCRAPFRVKMAHNPLNSSIKINGESMKQY